MSNDCRHCDGHGLVIRKVDSKMYACGFVQQAFECPFCVGTGRQILIPKPSFLERVWALFAGRAA